MLPTYSIKSLYTLALAEGEGVGTAYEYFAKRLVLANWLKRMPRPKTILIAGLPEKYGCSLDFLLLAADLGAMVTVVDERPSALEKLQQTFTAVQQQNWLTSLTLHTRRVTNLTDLTELEALFDLCVASEVLQRLPTGSRATYCHRLQELGTAVALFTPNADNPSHTHISGLSGLHLNELKTLFRPLTIDNSQLTIDNSSLFQLQFGYIDMPPFPPGITRSAEQRTQASSGKLEALAMWGLGFYAHLEKFLPHTIRCRQSHIVYGLVKRPFV